MYNEKLKDSSLTQQLTIDLMQLNAETTLSVLSIDRKIAFLSFVS